MEKISFYGQKVIVQFMLFFLYFVLMIGTAVFCYFFFSLQQIVTALVFLVLTLAFLVLAVNQFRRLFRTLAKSKEATK